MDRLASVLLAFPPQGDETTASSNEQYDRAIKAHLTALAKLGKEQQLVAAHAHTLLQVRLRTERLYGLDAIVR
jgi:hypothetical protein